MENSKEHSHYFKDVGSIKQIDVYRVLRLFPTGSAAIDHAVKKLLVPGARGSKDRVTDVKEAIDSLLRELVIMGEDAANNSENSIIAGLQVAAGKLHEKVDLLTSLSRARFGAPPMAVPPPPAPRSVQGTTQPGFPQEPTAKE